MKRISQRDIANRDNTATCGALKVLKAEDMEAIYKMAKG